MQPRVYGVDVMRNRIDLLKRFYLCLSDGTWVRVAKAEYASWIKADHRSESLYVVTEEYEKNVGPVMYVQPIPKPDWVMVAEGHSEGTIAGEKYTVTRVERRGNPPWWVSRRGNGDFLSKDDYIGDARHACMIDYADRRRGIKGDRVETDSAAVPTLITG
jgi:hypothetical protein